MFYITQFYKLIWKSGFKGAAFLLITITLMFLNFAPESLREKLLGQTKVINNQSSFYVLTDAKLDQNFLERKIYKLASVKKVTFFTEQELNQRIDDVRRKMKLDDIQFDMNLIGFRVLLSDQTKGDKIELIQQYIQRQAPIANFTFSALVEPEETPGYLAKHSALIALFGLALSWLLLAMLIIKPIQKKSYLLEKFQRKNWVALKIVGSGMCLFLVLNFAGVYFLQDYFKPSVVASSGLFFIFIIAMLRKNKWKA